MSKFVPEIGCQQADLVITFLVSIEQHLFRKTQYPESGVETNVQIRAILHSFLYRVLRATSPFARILHYSHILIFTILTKFDKLQ
jgi:hypothetical protein